MKKQRMLNSVLLGLFGMALAATTGSAAEGEPAYRRWAIVANRTAEEKGLADLLTAELASRNDLELVERQKLGEVAKELELSACLGADASEKRLKLGRILGADAMVLLSVEEPKSQSLPPSPPRPGQPARPAPQPGPRPILRVVISECRYGARLTMQHRPYSNRQCESLVRTCGQLVDETRRHFSGGIRQVIGVTHFLAKNLRHDYDHLQAGYAYLLESSLMSCPGVAVVETEEARAIGREHEIADEGLNDRVMPLFLEGEFAMTAAKPGDEPTVRLTLRATDGQQTRWEAAKQGLSLAEATEFLREAAPRAIVRLAQESADAGLDRKQQFVLLAKRADAMAQYEAFEHSTGLREAALLLEPNDLEQRVRLIGDHVQWSGIRQREFWKRWEPMRQYHMPHPWFKQQGLEAEWQKYSDARAAIHDEHLGRMIVLAGHLEHVVHRRLVNPNEANELAAAAIHCMLGGPVDLPRPRRTEAHRVYHDAMWRIYSLFPKLDPALRDGHLGPAVLRFAEMNGGPVSAYGLPHLSGRAGGRLQPIGPLVQYDIWTRSAGEFFAFFLPSFATATEYYTVVGENPAAKWDADQVLGDLFRFLTEVTSPEVPVPWMTYTTLAKWHQSLNTACGRRRLTCEELRPFYERLKQTNKPVCVLYGRLGLLGMQSYCSHVNSVRIDVPREIEELMALVQQFDTGKAEYELVRRTYREALETQRESLAKATQKPPTSVPQVKRHELPPDPIAADDAETEVIFEPIEGLKAKWTGILQCTATMDVVWNDEAVDILEAKGATREIFRLPPAKHGAEPADRVLAAYWDGQSVWIACSESGIYVVLPAGGTAAHVGTEAGLPPYGTAEMGILLHPVSPGKCLAMGNFTHNQRTWIALISESQQGLLETRVLHTATKARRQPGQPSDTDLEEIFLVRWMGEIRPPWAPDKRLLLVGRAMAGRPLAIDLATFQVSLFPARMPAAMTGKRFVLPDGHAVQTENHGIRLLNLPGLDAADWEETQLLEFKERRALLFYISPLLTYQGVHYQPGRQWFRFDPRTWTGERLHTTAMPLQDPFARYAVSAHYGPVAWNRHDALPHGVWPGKSKDWLDTMYRVVLRPRPSAKDDLRTRYPYVPPAALERHHRAVEAIRELGGNVDTRWGFIPKPSLSTTGPAEGRTIVYLPANWKGGDAGLAHLGDLHSLRDLYLVRADISNEGLRQVGHIASLHSLYLVETKATDAGLAHLKSLTNLSYLRLEGTVGGGEFGSAVLPVVQGFEMLEGLTLYGDGFTDEGMPVVRALPRIGRVWLLNTRVTQAGLNKARLTNISVLWSTDNRSIPAFD